MVTKFSGKFAMIMLQKNKKYCRCGLTHLDAKPTFESCPNTYEPPCNVFSYKKVPLFCRFDHFLDSWAEICQIFRWFFGNSMTLTPNWHSEINWSLKISNYLLKISSKWKMEKGFLWFDKKLCKKKG